MNSKPWCENNRLKEKVTSGNALVQNLIDELSNQKYDLRNNHRKRGTISLKKGYIKYDGNYSGITPLITVTVYQPVEKKQFDLSASEDIKELSDLIDKYN